MSRSQNILQAVKALLAIGRPLRVLIVEDHIDLARMMTLLLQQCGFEVRTLNDGFLVLSTALSFRPQFVLLDLSLPVMNGFEVAEQLRADASLKDTKIIALSAYGPEMFAPQLKKAGIDHYLTKPVELKDLLGVLVPSFFA